VLFATAARTAPAAVFNVRPEAVLVVANQNDPDSLALAKYYMDAREIPAANLIKIAAAGDEEISWDDFASTIWNPLVEHLAAENWLIGSMLPKPDAQGRRRISARFNRVGYLVLCRGVPLRIRNAPPPDAERDTLAKLPVPLRTTGAAVDSELALLPAPASPATAFLPNPLFQKTPAAAVKTRSQIIIVSRLDGPSFADCRQLVDNALLAEKNGLAGRAYVDLGGRYPEGDKWLRAAADTIAKAGFDVSREETPALFCFETRADAPAFYLGWYAQNAAGRFADPWLRFAPGAIAFHLHSFSAATLRSDSQNWVGPLVARGATLSFGNVAEPFLHLTTRPDTLVAALFDGAQAGDAHALATPALSWQNVLVGDPLYQPFRVPLKTQLQRLRAGGPASRAPALRCAILLREANRLVAAGKNREARDMLAAETRAAPTPALRLALAKLAKIPSLAFAPDDGDAIALADAGLLIEIARYLAANALFADAAALYTKILVRKGLPSNLRTKLTTERDEARNKATERWQPRRITPQP